MKHGSALMNMDPKLLLLSLLFLVQTSTILTLIWTKCYHPSYIGLPNAYAFRGTNSTINVTTDRAEIIREKPLGILGPIMSGCTLADMQKRAGVVLLTTTNMGFLDLTLNMLQSIKLAGICVNMTIIAEDEKAYDYIQSTAGADPAIHVMKTNIGKMIADKLMVHTAKYKYLVNKRQQYILNLLRQGLEVLFTDADTFWFRDPFDYFQGDFDMSFVDERSPYPTRLPKKSLHCAGLGYFKPTNRTLQFLGRWIQKMNVTKDASSDQGVLNGLLHHDEPVHVNVKPLPLSHFPHALLYYKPDWRKANNETIIMHSVGIRGHDKKVKKFKENGMWLIGNFSAR